MTKTGQKILARTAALPAEDQAAVEHDVLNYIEWLTEMKAGLARSETDIEAGRVKPADEVFDRLLAKYVS